MNRRVNNADIVVRFVDEIEGHEGAFGAAVNYYTLGEGESAQEFSESQWRCCMNSPCLTEAARRSREAQGMPFG